MFCEDKYSICSIPLEKMLCFSEEDTHEVESLTEKEVGERLETLGIDIAMLTNIIKKKIYDSQKEKKLRK